MKVATTLDSIRKNPGLNYEQVDWEHCEETCDALALGTRL